MEIHTGLCSLVQGKYFKASRGTSCVIEDLQGTTFTFRFEECFCSEHMGDDGTHSINVDLREGDDHFYFYVKVYVYASTESGLGRELICGIEVEDLDRVKIAVEDDEVVELVISDVSTRDAAREKWPWFENHKGNMEWIGTLLPEKPVHS